MKKSNIKKKILTTTVSLVSPLNRRAWIITAQPWENSNILLIWNISKQQGLYQILLLKYNICPMHSEVSHFSSVAQSCLTLCNPMNCSTPGLPVHHQLPESTQTHVHWVGDAIQPSHLLLSPSPPAPNPSQHQNLFQWVNSSHEVVKVLEFQLQHQSFQWTPRTDL